MRSIRSLVFSSASMLLAISIVVSASLLPCEKTHAQSPLSLKECLINRSIAAESLLSGDFVYQMAERKSGKEEWETIRHGRYVWDRRIDGSLHDQVMDLRTVAERQESNWRPEITEGSEQYFKFGEWNPKLQSSRTDKLYGICAMVLGDVCVVIDSRGSSGSAYRKDQLIPFRFSQRELLPFDVRTFGYGYEGEFVKQSSFDDVMKAMYTWVEHPGQLVEPINPIVNDDGTLTFSNGQCIVIDPHKDFVCLKHDDGRSQKKSVRSISVDYEQINGVWVPKKLFQRFPRGDCEILIKWRSVNELMDPNLLSANRLKVYMNRDITNLPGIELPE